MVVVSVGCDPSDAEGPAQVDRAVPESTLHTHIVEPSTPTAEGLAYLRAVAQVHRQADERGAEARIRVLRQGLSLPIPAGLPEAEIMRLDLAARLGEELMSRSTTEANATSGGNSSGARVARDLLRPMLAVDNTVPLDRATARALVVLGDAAAKTGDDALAVGSYSRSIQIMSLLRQELEP